MSDRIRFTVSTLPIAQPRHKVATIAGQARAYIAAKHPVHQFKSDCRSAAAAHVSAPLDGPIALTLTFVMPRPQAKRWKKREQVREPHASKPDLDNLCKAATDALNGILFVDDSRIAFLSARKLIAAGDEQPRVEVEAWIVAEYVPS